jgi:hypothetical protein
MRNLCNRKVGFEFCSEQLVFLFRKTIQANNLEEHCEKLGSGRALKNNKNEPEEGEAQEET